MKARVGACYIDEISMNITTFVRYELVTPKPLHVSSASRTPTQSRTLLYTQGTRHPRVHTLAHTHLSLSHTTSVPHTHDTHGGKVGGSEVGEAVLLLPRASAAPVPPLAHPPPLADTDIPTTYNLGKGSTQPTPTDLTARSSLERAA